MYVTARPSAGYSHEQTQTRVAITHKARVPKLHAIYREGGGVPLRVRPPRAFGNVQLALWRSQPVGTPPDVSQAVAATYWQIRFCMQTSLWHTSDAHINHIRRDMLANMTPHANFALAPKGRRPHQPIFAAICWQIGLRMQILSWHKANGLP